MPTMTAEEAFVRCAAVLRDRRVPAVDAHRTSRVLVEATCRGYPLQGLERLPAHVQALVSGAVEAHAERRVVREGPAFAVIDGGGGLGHPAAVEAIELGVAKAATAGVAAVGVIRSGHIGSVGCYTAFAARRGCVAVGMTTSEPAGAVPGGSRRVLGTNPLAFSVPTGGDPITADFVTTSISRSRLLASVALGEVLDEGVGWDARGRTTTDPAVVATSGALAPMGGDVRGALLGFLVGELAGPLVGGPANVDVDGTRTVDVPPSKGDLFVVISVAHLGDPEAFVAKTERQMQAMTASSPTFRRPGREVHLGNGELLDVSDDVQAFLGSAPTAEVDDGAIERWFAW
jgi:L-2-hydroxycarboxylate dehydrogenase (NAD+)